MPAAAVIRMEQALSGFTGCKGAGREIIKAVEALAVNDHKERVRLDCSIDNPFLNQYYESMWYEMAGTCKDGGYEGNRREKYMALL